MQQTYKENYFKFKRFGLYHGDESFKIGTDGVILGAWAGQGIQPKTVLDIGTGSGLIALMLAQRFKSAIINGIEINSEAAKIAQMNFLNSPFKNRLDSLVIDLKKYESNKTFDLIVSNPPFFKKSLLPDSETNIRSKHGINITSEDIFRFSSKYLNRSGKLSIIYPHNQIEGLQDQANTHLLFISNILHIRPKPDLKAHRCILELSKVKSEIIDMEHLCIEKDERHNFHASYVDLCKDFYLKF